MAYPDICSGAQIKERCRTAVYNFTKNKQANELFKLFERLHLYLIPYNLKYSTASTRSYTSTLHLRLLLHICHIHTIQLRFFS